MYNFGYFSKNMTNKLLSRYFQSGSEDEDFDHKNYFLASSSAGRPNKL